MALSSGIRIVFIDFRLNRTKIHIPDVQIGLDLLERDPTRKEITSSVVIMIISALLAQPRR